MPFSLLFSVDSHLHTLFARQFPHGSSARIIRGHCVDYPRPLRGFSTVATRIISVGPRGTTTEFCRKCFLCHVLYILLPQNPSATMSRCAPSSLFAVLWWSGLPCKGCRGGSLPNPWQTSVRHLSVISHSSLCLPEVRPLQGQLSACSAEKFLMQTQVVGRSEGYRQLRKQRTSWKAPLLSAKLCSAIGRVESKLDAPFSLENFTVLSCCWLAFLGAQLHLKCVAVDESYVHHACLSLSFLQFGRVCVGLL